MNNSSRSGSGINNSYLNSQPNPFHTNPTFNKNPVQANSTWLNPASLIGMNGQTINQMNPNAQKAMKEEYEKNFFNYFMFEHQTAPISSGVKGVQNSPIVSFIYKWDFLEKRYKCLKENDLLKSGRVDRFELVQFLQNLHSLNLVNPKNTEKTKLGVFFAIFLLLFLASLTLFFFVYAPTQPGQGFFTTMRIIIGSVATGLFLPLMIFFLIRILNSNKRHSKALAERKKKIEQFLQRINIAIAPRGLRWKVSPYGSWMVLSLGFKKGVNEKKVRQLVSERAKENALNSEFKGGRSFNKQPNRGNVLNERDINVDVLEESSRRPSLQKRESKPMTFQNSIKNSVSTSKFDSKNSLEFNNKKKTLTSNLKYKNKNEEQKNFEKKKSLGEIGLFNQNPYGSDSESESKSSDQKKKGFKNRNLMDESYYKGELDSSEYRISKSRKKIKRSEESNKYEAELPEIEVMNKSSKRKAPKENYESRRQAMPWDDIDDENDQGRANRGRESQERGSIQILSQPSYEMLEIRDPGRQRNNRMGRFLLDEVKKELRETHEFNVYGEKFSPNEANRSYLRSGKKGDSSRKRRGMPW